MIGGFVYRQSPLSNNHYLSPFFVSGVRYREPLKICTGFASQGETQTQALSNFYSKSAFIQVGQTVTVAVYRINSLPLGLSKARTLRVTKPNARKESVLTFGMVAAWGAEALVRA